MVEGDNRARPAGGGSARLRAALDPIRPTHALLAAVLIELALYRLAVPALAPSGDVQPPRWHAVLSYGGLYAFYLACALALVVALAHLGRLAFGLALWWRAPRRPDRGGRARVAGGLLAATQGASALAGLALLALAAAAVIAAPGVLLSFWLEGVFALAACALVVAQIGRGGDLGARVGLALIALPLVVHFWGPLAVHVLHGEEARWSALPDRLDTLGLKLLVIAAVLSPYCFSPRPFVASASRPLPLGLAVAVLATGLALLRVSATTLFRVAADGFGIDLGAGVPVSELVLYGLAIVTLSWTIFACLVLGTPARRRVGIGLALVVLAGYGFVWPLQLLCGFAGLLTIADAAREVRDEERRTDDGAALAHVRPPPIPDETWQAWLRALTAALRERGAQTVTVRGDGDVVRSHVVATIAERPVRLTVERLAGSISGIDVLVGREPGEGPPALTVEARAGERRGASRLHPPPPSVGGRPVLLGDPRIDRRFRIVDGGGHARALFGDAPDDAAQGDDGPRARIAAALDGWLALWPGVALRHRVHPGRGAPLDRPVPISELAFRGADPPPSTAPVVALLALLVELAERGDVPETRGADAGAGGEAGDQA